MSMNSWNILLQFALPYFKSRGGGGLVNSRKGADKDKFLMGAYNNCADFL